MEELFSEENKIIPIVFSAIFLLLFMAVALMLFFRFARQKIVEKELEKKDLKIAYQKQRMQAILKVQEKERTRIAQDMHDAISAKLSVLNLTAYSLIDNTINPKQKASLEHILAINNTVLESARKIAHDLLPPVLEKFGLKVALEELFDSYEDSGQVIILQKIKRLPKLTKEKELHLFRIFQELLSNSVKHGKATKIEINNVLSKQGIGLVYKDNGCGFTLEEVKEKAGLGLQNIKNRINILGGKLIVSSNPETGSVFNIEWNNE